MNNNQEHKSAIIAAQAAIAASIIAAIATLGDGLITKLIPSPSVQETTAESSTPKRSEIPLPEKDPKVVELKSYIDRCYNNDDGKACNSAGIRIGDGRGAHLDLEKSADLYNKACELGNKTGCYNYGLRLERGKGIKTDLEQAKLFYIKACELGHTKACEKSSRT